MFTFFKILQVVFRNDSYKKTTLLFISAYSFTEGGLYSGRSTEFCIRCSVATRRCPWSFTDSVCTESQVVKDSEWRNGTSNIRNTVTRTTENAKLHTGTDQLC